MESRRRVFVSDQEECPENAILREDQGSLFYVPGQVHDGTVGGPRGDVMDGIERSDEVFKPFGPYDDMDSCISDNQDKDDPGAYCASIHHEATGEWPAEKGRVYVSDPSDAPEEVDVQEGQQGGYYYETDQGQDGSEDSQQQTQSFSNDLSPELANDAQNIVRPHLDSPQTASRVDDLDAAKRVIEQLGEEEIEADPDDLRSASDLLSYSVGLQMDEGQHTEFTQNVQRVEFALRDVADELEEKMTGKIYVASEEEAPDGVELKEDGDKLYYEKQQAYEHARALYADDVEDEIEDETDVEMPNADDAGDGTAPEEEFDQELEDLRSQIHDVEDETGPVSVE